MINLLLVWYKKVCFGATKNFLSHMWMSLLTWRPRPKLWGGWWNLSEEFALVQQKFSNTNESCSVSFPLCVPTTFWDTSRRTRNPKVGPYFPIQDEENYPPKCLGNKSEIPHLNFTTPPIISAFVSKWGNSFTCVTWLIPIVFLIFTSESQGFRFLVQMIQMIQ